MSAVRVRPSAETEITGRPVYWLVSYRIGTRAVREYYSTKDRAESRRDSLLGAL